MCLGKKRFISSEEKDIRKSKKMARILSAAPKLHRGSNIRLLLLTICFAVAMFG